MSNSPAAADVPVSVILPTYNEAPNIVRLIHAIQSSATRPTEIVVVDDDSPDGTWRLVEELGATDPRVRVIRRIGERGLTSAIQEGIDRTMGDPVVWMDCDFSMPPEMIPTLVDKVIVDGYDAAVGSRFARGGSAKGDLEGTEDSRLGVALSNLLNGILRFWLDPSFRDYTSGFIACRRKMLEEIRLSGDYGEYFIDLMYRAIRRGYSVIEIPYVCAPREFGESKTGSNLWQYGRRGIKYLWTAFKLRFSRP